MRGWDGLASITAFACARTPTLSEWTLTGSMMFLSRVIKIELRSRGPRAAMSETVGYTGCGSFATG